MSDDPVVLALRAALASHESVDVRLALADHLLRQAKAKDALVEYEAALALSPIDARALQGASSAAEALGEHGKAQAYLTALKHLRPAPTSDALFSVPPTLASPADRGVDEAEASTSSATRGPIRLVARDGQSIENVAAPSITFEDVAGMETVKGQLERAFLMPLRNPEIHKRFGKRIRGGLLLYGPPGCGKTYIARALAGEAGAHFVNVGFSDVLDMWYGETERKIHEIFENARRRAPTLLFFDEVDALGHKRSKVQGAGRNTVNALLSEMDGFGGGEGVFFLAATNHPWDVDTALRRPGRFDRLVFVPPPDRTARQALLRWRLQERPTDSTLDIAQLAERTESFSGADLEALVERATEFAVEASLKSGAEKPINALAIKHGLSEVEPSTRPWFDLARNYAVYANEGGVYDALYEYLKERNLA